MAYAIIKINPDTKRIESARLYDTNIGENEYEVNSLPNGDITHYLFENDQYVYDHVETEWEKREREYREELALKNELNENMADIMADYEYRLCMLELGSTE